MRTGWADPRDSDGLDVVCDTCSQSFGIVRKDMWIKDWGIVGIISGIIFRVEAVYRSALDFWEVSGKQMGRIR